MSDLIAVSKGPSIDIAAGASPANRAACRSAASTRGYLGRLGRYRHVFRRQVPPLRPHLALRASDSAWWAACPSASHAWWHTDPQLQVECRRSARRPYALLVGLGACVYPAAAWAQCRGAGLTARAGHLYALRFLLGAAEAGAFPCMWAYLTRFYAGGPDLALAWSFIAAAQPLAQVRAHWVVHRQGIG